MQSSETIEAKLYRNGTLPFKSNYVATKTPMKTTTKRKGKALKVKVNGELYWFIPRKDTKNGILIEPNTKKQEFITGYFRKII